MTLSVIQDSSNDITHLPGYASDDSLVCSYTLVERLCRPLLLEGAWCEYVFLVFNRTDCIYKSRHRWQILHRLSLNGHELSWKLSDLPWLQLSAVDLNRWCAETTFRATTFTSVMAMLCAFNCLTVSIGSNWPTSTRNVWRGKNHSVDSVMYISDMIYKATSNISSFTRSLILIRTFLRFGDVCLKGYSRWSCCCRKRRSFLLCSRHVWKQ